MQAMCRILRPDDASAADALQEQWRESVRQALEEDNPWLFTLEEGVSPLTLYWRHLPTEAYESVYLDWKDTDSLAGINSLPGTNDWHWDKDEDGYGMEDGLQALAKHLAAQGLVLINLDTGGDAYLLTVVPAKHGQALLDLLETAEVRSQAWLPAMPK